MSDDGSRYRGGEQNWVAERRELVTSGGTDMEFSGVFEVLANERRRFALYYLRDHDPADIDQLAAHITAWEQGKSADNLGAETSESVLLDLYHCHIPKLAEVGIVEFDPRTGKLRYREPPAFLDELLERTAAVEFPDV